MKTNAELLKTLLDITTDNIYVNNPCQVVNVSSDGNFVDVKIFINDEDEDCVLYNVPIQRPETQRAYIFLGIKKGDRGTLKFFDRSTEGYRQGDYDYNSDERQHDINDSCFELGFIPDAESYVYPIENVALTVDEIIPDFNSDDFNTVLTPQEEIEYQQWYSSMKSQGYIVDGDVGYDYDFRGAFKAGFSPIEVGGHWVDTWKKPNHETFSNESIYAKGEYEKYAGSWNGDNYKMPESRIMPDPEIEIGLKNGICKISIQSDGTLNICSNIAINIIGNVTINGSLTVTGEVTGGTSGTSSIELTQHYHTDSQGGDTTKPSGNIE